MSEEKRKARIAISNEGFQYINYFNALQDAGAQAEVFDPQKGVGWYDGLLIPGGGDVDPRLYGQSNRYCEYVRPEVDAIDASCLEMFARLGKPVLGICRGQQLINVAYGGSLIQDIRSELKHHTEVDGETISHRVSASRRSFLSELYGEEFTVNSSHHQAVLNLAMGFEVLLTAEDGIVEAIQHQSLPIYGVQFHPERMRENLDGPPCADGMKIIRWFVSRCLAKR
ncbi:MAG: gamma-glutamyl-gamma-aminobutyrate hydrolase family protein [Erysipelotrichaceae bacterium]|nr:gamma-glutamyl-gamma-aminobutyrate hydrolase family protein [Erysipelotrichaceae bacterium]